MLSPVGVFRSSPFGYPGAAPAGGFAPNALLSSFMNLGVHNSRGQATAAAISLCNYAFQQIAPGASDPQRAMALLQSLMAYASHAGTDNFSVQGARHPGFPSGCWIPPPAFLPPPRAALSGPPAGNGLTVASAAENGWPASTITTAGGYRIVAEGSTNWSIYGPGQNATDKPLTRVWGDPHVAERDGTKWDFTGDKGLDGAIGNDFVLGDGTRIFAETSADTGQSITKGLVISNGADRVVVTDVNTTAKVGSVQHDGYEWRARHVAMSGNRAWFVLGGNGQDKSDQEVQWARIKNGRMEGVVDAGELVNGRYEQKVDASKTLHQNSTLRPPFGSPAWGNSLRSQLNDALALGWSQRLGPDWGSWRALADSAAIRRDHDRRIFLQENLYFSGWNGWNSWNSWSGWT